MADEEQQVAAPQPPTQQQVDDHLGSFEFNDAPPPEQRRQAPPQEAAPPPTQEQPQEQQPQEQPPPSLEPPDPEIDWNGRKYKTSEIKRGLDKYRQQITEFQRRQQAFNQQTQGFTQYQQQAAEMLRNAVQMVEHYMPRKPDPKLAETDPFAYQAQRANYEAAAEKVQVARQNEATFRQQAQAQQRYREQQYIANQANATLQRLPELKDPVKFAKWSEDAKSVATSLGYTPADLAYVRDHRLVALLNEAIENRRNKAAIESVKAKLKAQQAERPAPPVQQPQRTRRSAATVQSENMRAALTRLRNNPSSSQAAEDVLSRFD